jgi:serine/threonine protein kinase/esterase/lipase
MLGEEVNRRCQLRTGSGGFLRFERGGAEAGRREERGAGGQGVRPTAKARPDACRGEASGAASYGMPDPDPNPDLETRTRLERLFGTEYRLDRELGRGGMATVWLAEDLRHGRQVAIKVLRPELAGGIVAERFLREIAITAQLLHPHILTLIDSGAADGLFYYVMPYVAGESLRARLDREGELPLPDVLRILREVVDALAHAHGHGIVHRDIKPENVLLSGDHSLVADFGIAKAVVAAAREGGGLTSIGVTVGTPAYMAPEQAAADPGIDARADLYSAGVLAYEMITGRTPFSGATAQQLMTAHLTRDPEPPGRLRPSLPDSVEQLVMRCLAKRPADRWRSADELRARLDAIMTASGAPHLAKPRDPVARRFALSEAVCRKLDRATLDPRVIGDALHYLDNDVDSPVLLCFLHGTGFDGSQFDAHLRQTGYRAIAPTLYGFEPAPPRRIALSLEDHLVILREFLSDAVARLRPETVVLVGFSSGGDLALRMVADEPGDPPRRADGIVALGANVTLETCFVTRLLDQVTGDDPQRVLAALRTLVPRAETLDDWLNIHEYLVTTLRKFQGTVAPLRRFSADIVRPFESAGRSPFVTWLRVGSERVRRLRCVLEDIDMVNRPLRELRLRNLDEDVFGPHYREDSIVTEPGTDHFDLVGTGLILRHVEEIVADLRSPRAPLVRASATAPSPDR